jgi:hypothetical protein
MFIMALDSKSIGDMRQEILGAVQQRLAYLVELYKAAGVHF